MGAEQQNEQLKSELDTLKQEHYVMKQKSEMHAEANETMMQDLKKKESEL